MSHTLEQRPSVLAALMQHLQAPFLSEDVLMADIGAWYQKKFVLNQPRY